MKARGGGRSISYPYNLGSRWLGWSVPRPGRFIHGKGIRFFLCRRLVRNNPSTTGMDFRNFQANASRYTEYTIAAASNNCTGF